MNKKEVIDPPTPTENDRARAFELWRDIQDLCCADRLFIDVKSQEACIVNNIALEFARARVEK